jgi:hypothetical protein
MQIQPVDAAYFEGDVVTDNVGDPSRPAFNACRLLVDR